MMLEFITLHIFVLVTSLLGISAAILITIIILLNLRIKKLLGGANSSDLETSIKKAHEEIKNLEKFRKELEAYLTGVETRLKKSVQSVQTVRFNPFKGNGSGSNQSFATTFINEEGDGVVISSLYSRDHVSIFSKPVKSHVPEFELSEEELESLEKAKKHLR
jgi:hypothetical protein